MDSATSVFIVQHVHVHASGDECVKMIGVYLTRTAALEAVGRLAEKPGFRDYPQIINPIHDEEASGFYIDEYDIGEDHWSEGYVTDVPNGDE